MTKNKLKEMISFEFQNLNEFILEKGKEIILENYELRKKISELKKELEALKRENESLKNNSSELDKN